MKPKCEKTKVTAPEVPVQEQHIGKCIYCNTIYKVTVGVSLDTMLKHCMNCGQPIIYKRKGE